MTGVAPLTVTVAPVAVRPTRRLLKFVGTLFGNEEVTLSSQVEGQLERVRVDLGDQVVAGQVLAEIDDVSQEQLAQVGHEYLDPDRQTVVWLGPN